jgi:divalent metal cation (Fe/Co/Zn/Cd) transporter
MKSTWTRIALWLVGATLAYNAAEAVVAVWAGARAGSIALVGFGFDSVIETAAAVVLLWRLRAEARGADPEALEKTETWAERFVGITFWLLAAYVTINAIWTLATASAPEESLVGIILAIVSLIVMPVVAAFKIKAAGKIGSGALRAEAKETLACSYLSFALLAGLLANALFGAWWADPAAALLMVPWLVKEGKEAIFDDGC